MWFIVVLVIILGFAGSFAAVGWWSEVIFAIGLHPFIGFVLFISGALFIVCTYGFIISKLVDFADEVK